MDINKLNSFEVVVEALGASLGVSVFIRHFQGKVLLQIVNESDNSITERVVTTYDA